MCHLFCCCSVCFNVGLLSAVFTTNIYSIKVTLDALSKAGLTFDQVERIGIYLQVPHSVTQRVRAEYKDAALCAVRVIQAFWNDCELPPSEQDKQVASALRQSGLSAVAAKLYQVPHGKMAH